MKPGSVGQIIFDLSKFVLFSIPIALLMAIYVSIPDEYESAFKISLMILYFLWKIVILIWRLNSKIHQVKQSFALKNSSFEYILLFLIASLFMTSLGGEQSPSQQMKMTLYGFLFLFELLYLYLLTKYQLNRIIITNKEIILQDSFTQKIPFNEDLILKKEGSKRLKLYNRQKDLNLPISRLEKPKQLELFGLLEKVKRIENP